MEYWEFKREQDIKWRMEFNRLQSKANMAYNKGLWGAVKYNPFKWWVYLAYKREV